MKADGGLKMKESKDMNLRLKSHWVITCTGSDGQEKWKEEQDNLIVTEGLTDLLDKYFKGSSYTATWYVGLKDTGTALAADTMASHSSWAEIVPYSDSNRPTLTLGTPSAGSVDNSASKASFTINATDDVYGAFTTTNNTKSGTSGVLYGVVDFSSTRSVISGDTLEAQVTLTSASA